MARRAVAQERSELTYHEVELTKREPRLYPSWGWGCRWRVAGRGRYMGKEKQETKDAPSQQERGLWCEQRILRGDMRPGAGEILRCSGPKQGLFWGGATSPPDASTSQDAWSSRDTSVSLLREHLVLFTKRGKKSLSVVFPRNISITEIKHWHIWTSPKEAFTHHTLIGKSYSPFDHTLGSLRYFPIIIW